MQRSLIRNCTRTTHYRLIAFCIASIALFSACTTTTRPGVVGVNRQQLMMASQSEVERLSAISFSEQNKKAQDKKILITSGPQYDRLINIANRLIPQTAHFRDDTQKWNWQLSLINSPILNATCAPGGKITFYTGIIDQLKLNDDEVAAIMGHEIAHALREHGRERLSQAMAQSTITSIALAAAGGYGVQINAANQVAQYVLVLPNSRQHESEADAIGVELAARAGYNPRAAISVWQKMMKATQGKNPPEFLSTHPSGETRIEQLSALMPAVEPLYRDAPKAPSSDSTIK
jgi:predicted Zn-dependent protease